MTIMPPVKKSRKDAPYNPDRRLIRYFKRNGLDIVSMPSQHNPACRYDVLIDENDVPQKCNCPDKRPGWCKHMLACFVVFIESKSVIARLTPDGWVADCFAYGKLIERSSPIFSFRETEEITRSLARRFALDNVFIQVRM